MTGWGLGSQDSGRRLCGVPEHERPSAARPAERALPCSLPCSCLCRVGTRSLQQRRAVGVQACEASLHRRFCLPTSTSSARGVVQFWLTRRRTPAAIYGHRHPGGVSGLCAFLSSPTPLRAAVRFLSFSACERAQRRRSRCDRYSRPHTIPKIPAFDSPHDLNDIFR